MLKKFWRDLRCVYRTKRTRHERLFRVTSRRWFRSLYAAQENEIIQVLWAHLWTGEKIFYIFANQYPKLKLHTCSPCKKYQARLNAFLRHKKIHLPKPDDPFGDNFKYVLMRIGKSILCTGKLAPKFLLQKMRKIFWNARELHETVYATSM